MGTFWVLFLHQFGLLCILCCQSVLILFSSDNFLTSLKKTNGNIFVVESQESVSLFSLTDSLSRVTPQVFVLLVYLEFPDSTLQWLLKVSSCLATLFPSGSPRPWEYLVNLTAYRTAQTWLYILKDF